MEQNIANELEKRLPPPEPLSKTKFSSKTAEPSWNISRFMRVRVDNSRLILGHTYRTNISGNMSHAGSDRVTSPRHRKSPHVLRAESQRLYSLEEDVRQEDAVSSKDSVSSIEIIFAVFIYLHKFRHRSEDFTFRKRRSFSRRQGQ